MTKPLVPTPALLKAMVLICCAVMFIQTLLHLIAAIRRRATGGER